MFSIDSKKTSVDRTLDEHCSKYTIEELQRRKDSMVIGIIIFYVVIFIAVFILLGIISSKISHYSNRQKW